MSITRQKWAAYELRRRLLLIARVERHYGTGVPDARRAWARELRPFTRGERAA